MKSQNADKASKSSTKKSTSKDIQNVLEISHDEYGTLELIASGALGEFKSLMNEKQESEVAQSGEFRGEIMPYAFTFAPNNEDAQHLLKSLKTKAQDTLSLSLDGQIVGKIKAKSIFSLKKANLSIFSAKNICFINENDQSGALAVSGEIELFNSKLAKLKKQVSELKEARNYRKVTAIMLTADPLHRLHERLIRMTIDKADLLIIFLVRTYSSEGRLSFELRYECLKYFCDNYLPQGRVVIVPFTNTTLFSDHINPVLEAIAAKNFGANKLVIGQNHTGIGLFYDNNQANTLLDMYSARLGLELIIMPQMFYCEVCHTLTSTKTCPHGEHHHIKYSSSTLKELLFAGLMPPAILMRKKISAIILDALFPNRFKSLQRIYDDLFANRGIVEKHDQRDFYEQLMRLYQTSSLN